MVWEKRIPEFLYKYKNLDGENRKWTEDIFKSSQIYFPSPEQLNDPFDCKVHLNFKALPEEKRKYLNSFFKRTRPRWNRKQRREQLKQNTKKLKDYKTKEDLRSSLQDDANKIGVLSLSEDPRNILMWAHYGHSHTGLCLEFMTDSSFFEYCFPVDYPEGQNFPEYNPIHQTSEDAIKLVFLTKCTDWKYEKEWRIIDLYKRPGLRSFPEELLTSVILGLWMNDEDCEAVLGWVLARKTQTKVYKTEINERSFKLDLIQIHPPNSHIRSET